MREIKVRFWDDLHNKFWYGGQEGESIGNKTFQTYFKNGVLIGILSEAVSYGINQTGVDDYQEHLLTSNVYTGLKDKNGKAIYEGDILKLVLVDWSDVQEDIFTVSSDNFVEDVCYLKAIVSHAKDVESETDSIEVIGNIYEHKHLLEEKKHV